MTKKRTILDRIMMREYIGVTGELAKKLHQLNGLAFLGNYITRDKFIKVNDEGYIRYNAQLMPTGYNGVGIDQPLTAKHLALDIFQLSKAKLIKLELSHHLAEKNGIYQKIQIEILGEDLTQIQGQVYFYEISDLNDFIFV